MISFKGVFNEFILTDIVKPWIKEIAESHEREMGDLTFILGNDNHLLALNREIFQHDYFTDVITQDYSVGKILHAEIFISLDRVKENAEIYKVSIDEELLRVIIHGLLHLCGFQDQTQTEIKKIRKAEDKALQLFHVKHKHV